MVWRVALAAVGQEVEVQVHPLAGAHHGAVGVGVDEGRRRGFRGPARCRTSIDLDAHPLERVLGQVAGEREQVDGGRPPRVVAVEALPHVKVAVAARAETRLQVDPRAPAE